MRNLIAESNKIIRGRENIISMDGQRDCERGAQGKEKEINIEAGISA